MGTKSNPGPTDCYAAAAPDEPIFVLRSTDPLAPILVDLWASMRERERGDADGKAREARDVASAMRRYRLSLEYPGAGKRERDDPPVPHLSIPHDAADLLDVLRHVPGVPSKAEALRLLRADAVRIDGNVANNPGFRVSGSFLLAVGGPRRRYMVELSAPKSGGFTPPGDPADPERARFGPCEIKTTSVLPPGVSAVMVGAGGTAAVLGDDGKVSAAKLERCSEVPKPRG